MVVLTSDPKCFENGMQLFLKNKETDCILHSQDAIKFNIHKEILYQSKLFENILIIGQSVCCKDIEIYCPCSENELESILTFLYDGKISSDEETKIVKTLDILTNIFYFPESLFSVEISNKAKFSEIFETESNEGNKNYTSKKDSSKIVT